MWELFQQSLIVVKVHISTSLFIGATIRLVKDLSDLLLYFHLCFLRLIFESCSEVSEIKTMRFIAEIVENILLITIFEALNKLHIVQSTCS